MSIAPGIQALSIYEDGGTSFQLNGQDISVDSPDISVVTRQSGRGTLKKVATSFEYVIRHDDQALHASLESAAHNTLQWKLVVIGFNSMFFLLDKATFVPEPTAQFDPESEDFPFQIRYVVRAGTQIAQGINGLYAYQKSQGNSTFADADSNNVADGFTNSGIETVSFAASVQTLTDTAGGGSFFIDIPFPFEGFTVTLAATYTLTSGTPDLVLRYLDSADATLASDIVTITAARKTAELASPANTFTVRLLLADDTTTFNITVTDPSLRIDGSSTFVEN